MYCKISQTKWAAIQAERTSRELLWLAHDFSSSICVLWKSILTMNMIGNMHCWHRRVYAGWKLRGGFSHSGWCHAFFALIGYTKDFCLLILPDRGHRPIYSTPGAPFSPIWGPPTLVGEARACCTTPLLRWISVATSHWLFFAWFNARVLAISTSVRLGPHLCGPGVDSGDDRRGH
jgi:hypothetical protein